MKIDGPSYLERFRPPASVGGFTRLRMKPIKARNPVVGAQETQYAHKYILVPMWNWQSAIISSIVSITFQPESYANNVLLLKVLAF